MVADLPEGPSINEKPLVGVSQLATSMNKKRMNEAGHLDKRGVSAKQSRGRLESARIKRKGIKCDKGDQGTVENILVEGGKRVLGVYLTRQRWRHPSLTVTVNSSYLGVRGQVSGLYECLQCFVSGATGVILCRPSS